MLWMLKSKLLKKTMMTGAYLVGLACHAPAFAQTVDSYYDGTGDAGKPGSIIKLEFYNPGDPGSMGVGSNRSWTAAEMNAVRRGMDYWWEVLGDGNTPARTLDFRLYRNYTPPFENAFAYGLPDVGSDPAKTMLETVWADNTNTPSTYGFDALLGFEFLSFSTSNTGVFADPGVSLEAVMIHEVAHALGYIGPANGVFGQYGRGPAGDQDPRLTTYETFIQNAAGEAVAAGDEYATGVPYYFTGAEATAVYGGRVPLNTKSNQLSHLGIPPLLMTHEHYRNYLFMTEVELAVLKDLGYDINLRNHFGKSYYQNNTFDFNSANYSMSKVYAIGSHIFANNSQVFYSGTTTTTGQASTGVRIDGRGNTFTLSGSGNLNIEGEDSVGILVSNGGSNVVRVSGDVNVTGANGTGIFISYGSNVLGEDGVGSLRSNTPSNENFFPGHTPGYLVDQLDLSGSINVTSGPAIHIDNTAAVREINILNGAQINGDIVTDGIIDSDYRLNRTTITFGHTNNSGTKGSGSDANFSFTYNDDILTKAGSPSNLTKAMNAVFAGGSASTGTVLNGQVSFYDVESLQLGRVQVNGDFYSNSILNAGIFGVSSGGTVRNAGLTNNAATGQLNINAADFFTQSLTNAGTINQTAVSRLLANSVVNSGEISLNNSQLLTAAMNNTGEISLSSGSMGYVDGDASNSGLMEYNNSSYTVVGSFINTTTGEFISNSSTINFNNGATNSGSMTLTDSNFNVSGENLVNQGQLHLVDSTTQITTDLVNSATFTQAGGTTTAQNLENALTGTFTLSDSAAFGLTQNLRNLGILNVTDGSLLEVAGNSSNGVQGRIDVKNATLRVHGDFDSNGKVSATELGAIRVLQDANLVKTSETALNNGLFSVTEDINLAGLFTSTAGTTEVINGDFIVTKDGRYRGINDLVDVQTGKLLVDGLFSSNNGIIDSASGVEVHKGGRFQGTPLVRTTLLQVDKDATLAPGNSIGTMSVDGNVLLNGTLESEITANPLAPQSSDLLSVSNGQVVINNSADYDDRGTFVFKQLPAVVTPPAAPGVTPVTPASVFDIATRFKIIETENDGDLQVMARSKTVDDLHEQRIVLRSDKDLDALYTAGARDYYAYVARDVDYTEFATSGNELVIANLLDSIKLIDDGTAQANSYQWLVDTIDLLETDDEVTDAIRQLSGGTTGMTHQLIAQQIHSNNQRFAAAMRADSDLMLDGEYLVKSNGLYGSVTGFGTGGNVKSTASQRGYDYNSAGTQVQIGYAQEGTHLGMYYNFTDSAIKAGHRINAEMHDFGGYMLLTDNIGHFLFNAGGGVTQLDYARNIRIGNTNIQNPIVGSYSASDNVPVYNANAEYGVNVPFGPMTLRPFGGLSYVYVDKATFDEGNDYLAIKARQTRLESFRSQLGTDIAMSLTKSHMTTVNVRTSWMHEFQGNQGGTYESMIVGVNTDPNVAQGIDLGTDFGLLGVTLSHHLVPNRAKIFGGYDLIGNNRHALHTGTAGVEIVW